MTENHFVLFDVCKFEHCKRYAHTETQTKLKVRPNMLRSLAPKYCAQAIALVRGCISFAYPRKNNSERSFKIDKGSKNT